LFLFEVHSPISSSVTLSASRVFPAIQTAGYLKPFGVVVREISFTIVLIVTEWARRAIRGDERDRPVFHFVHLLVPGGKADEIEGPFHPPVPHSNFHSRNREPFAMALAPSL